MNWSHAASTVVPVFLAAFVECIEALTIVLAVGAERGWRNALAGAALGLALLATALAVLGQALARIPIGFLQAVLGILLLLFGMRWLRKAILRSAGVLPLHDEAAAYARQTTILRQSGPGRATGAPAGWDGVALSTAFGITMVEGIEVVFIVIGVGAAGGGMLPASLGACAALLLVAGIGVALHRPLSAIPENTLKFAVGVLLCGFGTLWLGESMHLAWPGGDWSLPALDLGFLLAALGAVPLCRDVPNR